MDDYWFPLALRLSYLDLTVITKITKTMLFYQTFSQSHSNSFLDTGIVNEINYEQLTKKNQKKLVDVQSHNEKISL